MSLNILNAKKELKIVFTAIVFLVIFLFWTTFFTIKYINEVNFEKNDFRFFLSKIEKWTLSVEELINMSSRFDEKILNNREKQSRKIMWMWFVNYILVSPNWVILSSNIQDDLDSDFLDKIYSSNIYRDLIIENDFIIKKILFKNWSTFISLKKQKYNFTNYLSDIFYFFLIDFILSVLIFYIWNKFINKVFIPVEENINDMSDFIHNAGHELKTPISVIDSNIQLIDELKTYDKDMTKELKTEVLRLNSIIDWLVNLSNIDLYRELESLNLKDNINEILKEQNNKILEKNININVNIKDDVFIKSNKDYLYTFLSNIINNAIKYNVKWWNIDISYLNREIIIKDTWIWINDWDIKKVFDRFFQSDKSRNWEWFGIWLSLVKKIADIYKWKVCVKSKKWVWTKFIVKI